MDTRKIRKLIELVKETGIGELEIKSGEECVRISQPGQHVITGAPVTSQIVTTAAPTNNNPATAAPSAERAAAPTQTASAKDHTVKSPMVGTVYLGPTPGADPFVSVGKRVKAGDTLCLIEAMKMFNKIEADQSGIISARLVDNEHPVEYDQPLFIIEME